MRCHLNLHPLISTTDTQISIVARMLSDIPAHIRQEMEFIRPMVEERSAKMEEFGDDWDKPVCGPNSILLVFPHYTVKSE